jgi:hypothetical protein
MKIVTSSLILSFLAVLVAPFATAFNSPLFQQAQQVTIPAKQDGVPIELPDFDELFGRVQQVSPLYRLALEGQEGNHGARGDFDFIDRVTSSSDLKWKTIESNQRRLVSQVEKIDNFKGINAPILRFRSSMQGPCDGGAFAKFIMNYDDRKKWDAQIDDVYEAYTIEDLDLVNNAMGVKYGDCTKAGVGYCLTKPNLGIDAREQLTFCGINEFADGSSVIWGTEMEEYHNYLFPPGRRVTRSKSHLFSTTLIPTGPESFDVEYVIQLEVGGSLPNWMTTPIVIDNVKKLFSCAQDFYLNKDGELEKFLAEKAAARKSSDSLSASALSEQRGILLDDLEELKEVVVPPRGRRKHTLYL